jgi:hypothetical protein
LFGRRSAKQVALHIIDEFLGRAKRFKGRTEGLEHVFIPVLEELRRDVEAKKVGWDNVSYIVAVIINAFLTSFLYDCAASEEASTCRDALSEWLVAHLSTPHRWVAEKALKLLEQHNQI